MDVANFPLLVRRKPHPAGGIVQRGAAERRQNAWSEGVQIDLRITVPCEFKGRELFVHLVNQFFWRPSKVRTGGLAKAWRTRFSRRRMRAIAEQCHERPVQFAFPPAGVIVHDFRHALFCKVNRHRFFSIKTVYWNSEHLIMVFTEILIIIKLYISSILLSRNQK